MKIKDEKILRIEDVQKVSDRFHNINAIIQDLTRTIGFKDEGKTTLKPIISDDSPTYVNANYPAKSIRGTIRDVYSINKKRYFHNNFGINGACQLQDNKNLFIAGVESNDPTLEAELDKTMQTELNEAGGGAVISLNQTKKIINNIITKTRKKPIILVLGNKEEDSPENLDIYKKLSAVKKKLNSGITMQLYTLPINVVVDADKLNLVNGSGKEEDEDEDDKDIIEVYYLPDDKKHIKLSPKTLEALLDIYYRSIGSDRPLLVQCNDGLERSPKIAFAFEILRLFDVVFKDARMNNIRTALNNVFESVRRSHSPEALSDVAQVQQAVYLAFGLKIIDMFRQCLRKLEKYCKVHEDDPDFKRKQAVENGNHEQNDQSLKEILNSIVFDINNSDDDAKLHKNIFKMLLENKKLSNHYRWTFLPNIVRPLPDYTLLLETILKIIELKTSAFKDVLSICKGEKKEVRNDLDILEEEDGERKYEKNSIF